MNISRGFRPNAARMHRITADMMKFSRTETYSSGAALQLHPSCAFHSYPSISQAYTSFPTLSRGSPERRGAQVPCVPSRVGMWLAAVDTLCIPLGFRRRGSGRANSWLEAWAGSLDCNNYGSTQPMSGKPRLTYAR